MTDMTPEEAKKRLRENVMRAEMLQRAKVFSGEGNPQECTHKHARRLTGIFYSSVGLIHCLECKGWQNVKSAIL